MSLSTIDLENAENEVMPWEPKPWERDYTDEQRAEMKARKAAGELLPGHKNHHGNKYPRRDITGRDMAVLEFLARFKYSSTDQVSVLLQNKPNTAYQRLRGLEGLKLITRTKILGTGTLWSATPKALRLLETAGRLTADDDTQTVRKDHFDISAVGHTLAVNQFIAHLVAGRKMFNGQTPVELRNLVSEITIQREFGAIKKNVPSSMNLGSGLAGERLKKAVVKQIVDGSLSWDEAIDMNPALWTLTHGRTEPATHVEVKFPDLVINLEEKRTSKKALSIAVEVELNDKTAERYERIMRTYAEDRFVYSKIVYVLPAGRDALRKKIARAAQKAGFDKDRLVFVPLLDHTGKPFNDFAWKL